MGCTPPQRKNGSIPPVNAQPAHLMSGTSRGTPSIEDIIVNEPSVNWQSLRDLDVKMRE